MFTAQVKLDDRKLFGHQHYYGYAYGDDVQPRTALQLGFETLNHLDLIFQVENPQQEEEHKTEQMHYAVHKGQEGVTRVTFAEYMDRTITPFGMTES